MLAKSKLVFLLDVDNTLLDNDRFAADLTARLTQDFGALECDRFWAIYSALRDQRGYADYLGALQEFGSDLRDHDDMLQMSAFLLEYPFKKRLYPRVLEVISHLHEMGLLAILSDGDLVFQPRKLQRAGLWLATKGKVMIFAHKELEAEAIQNRYPAAHYVMVDDKPQLLAAMKKAFGDKLMTIFVSQGHYAEESSTAEVDPPPDRCIERIADLMKFNFSDFLAAGLLTPTN
jgi:FMN phosphatase YigB (HAD superfamily)